MAYVNPTKAAMDKIPTIANTPSISKRVRPFCLPHRRGEGARGCAPPICKGTARPNFFGAVGEKRKRSLQSDCPERPGHIPRAPAPAVENIPFNRENKRDLPSFPHPAENRADKQFIKRGAPSPNPSFQKIVLNLMVSSSLTYYL